MNQDQSHATVPGEKKLKDTYRKSYLMQAVGSDGNTIRTSIPRQTIEKEARKFNLTVKEFLEQYKIDWLFNSFPGLYGKFVPIDKEQKNNKEAKAKEK